MLFSRVLLAVCALLAVFAAAEGDSKVVTLTTADFKAKTATGSWLIKFYAPWCGHCKKLAPTWDELSGSASGFNVAKVDCTVEKDVCNAFGVRGYPTIKLVKDGSVYEYKNARTIEAFTSFAQSGFEAAPKSDYPKF